MNAPNSFRPSISLAMLLMLSHHLSPMLPSPGWSLQPLVSRSSSSEPGVRLSLRSATLRVLELQMDMASEDSPDGTWLDCIGLAKGLEDLKIWGVSLNMSTDWSTFSRLDNLEIVEADMTDDALKNTLQTCPNLTDLALLRCRGVNSIDIKMGKLENCRLELSRGWKSFTFF